MQIYTYSEARQKLAFVLEQAEDTGKVLIRRKDGRTFALVPERNAASPLDVPSIKAKITTKEIVDIIEKLKPFTATKFIDWDYKLDENGDKKVKTIYSLKIIKPANSETEQQSSIGETNLDNYSWKDIIVLAEKNKEMLNSVRNDKFEITKIFDTDSNILILFSI